jgi:hypothetical protein
MRTLIFLLLLSLGTAAGAAVLPPVSNFLWFERLTS